MKNIFLLTLILLNTTATISQALPANEIITASNFVKYVKNKQANNLGGNIFYNKEWNSKITINTFDQKKYTAPNANFNIKESVFVIKTPTDSIFKIEIDNTAFVIFDNKKFEFIQNNYYERLSKGKINLFKHYFLKLEEGRVDAISKIKVTKDKYVKAANYFIKTDVGLVKVKLSRKRIQNYFNDSKKKIMKKYSKSNGLSFKKEDDLKIILKHYNSL